MIFFSPVPRVFAMALCALLLGTPLNPAHAALPAEDKGAESATLNFVDADMDSVIKALGKVTGRNFVLDPRVKGKLNIVSVSPVPRATFYDIVLAALRLQGYAAVDKNGYTLILPEVDARQFGSRTGDMKGEGKASGLFTRVFVLRFEQPAQILAAVRPLVSNNNVAAAQTVGNSVVITDYGDNLTRIAAVIEAIDQPQGDEPVLIPLHNAAATDVAQILSRLMADSAGEKAPGAPGATWGTVLAEPRSNRLIVRTANPTRLARLRALAMSLDTPGVAGGQLHVVSLKNADASKMAQTLRALLGSETLPAATATPGAAAAPPAAAAPGQTGSASIQADSATNSIIIAAPEALYRSLRAVIAQLDTRRAQIYVEALIAEIDLNRLSEFGFQWQALSGIGKTTTQGIGGTNFGITGNGTTTNILGAAANPASVAPGLNIGVVRGTVTIAGQTMLNLGMLAHALDSDGKTHILSTPNLLTLDNEEAKIVIGENVPFVTGQYAQTGGAVTPTPFQTIERKDVGLTLRIKPLITESGTVRLQIFQEVSSVQQGTLNNLAGPSTNKRAIESTVLVDDGQIVALGGLIQEQTDQNLDKVPSLGDVPLIGQLFRSEKRQRSRTSLTIFLRPVIMRDGLQQAAFANSRYDSVREAQQAGQMPSHWLLPDMPSPTLPPRGAPAAK